MNGSNEQMEGIHITIVDDESAQLALLENYVREWAEESKNEIEITLCRSAEQFLFFREEKQETDILLLDIGIPDMNGISLARRLRARGDSAQIIFITGLSDYVLDGYDVEAVSYLLKPVKKERLFSCLNRAWKRCGNEEPFLLLELPGGAARVKLKDVCYLESAAHDTIVYCNGRPEGLRCKTGIQELEKGLALKSGAFCRVHRSYLIHLAYVSSINRREVVMDGGNALPVARSRWETLNQAYLDYYRRRQA